VERVFYSRLDSPVGPLTVAATETGVCTISTGPPEIVRARLQRRLGATVEEGTAVLDETRRHLAAYFEGDVTSLEVPMDLRLSSPYAQLVLKQLFEIPRGQFTTYGAIARTLQTSPRAVGQAVGSNPIPIVIPCHRVIAADGTLGGYSGGLDMKRALLKLEGYEALEGGWAPRHRAV